MGFIFSPENKREDLQKAFPSNLSKVIPYSALEGSVASPAGVPGASAAPSATNRVMEPEASLIKKIARMTSRTAITPVTQSPMARSTGISLVVKKWTKP